MRFEIKKTKQKKCIYRQCLFYIKNISINVYIGYAWIHVFLLNFFMTPAQVLTTGKKYRNIFILSAVRQILKDPYTCW